ncbi:MAG: hypothetical protein GWP02_00040 [Desulfobulbaceae bacterium]|nr:hypothetical protein [Desulfobulbaceae bacterium]
MSASKPVLFGALFLLGGLAHAGGDEPPDEDFLEYLGLWEESDEEWLIFEEPIAADNVERTDPAPDGEESTETEDES